MQILKRTNPPNISQHLLKLDTHFEFNMSMMQIAAHLLTKSVFSDPCNRHKHTTQNWSINIQHITYKLSSVSLFPSLWLTAPSVHPSINSLFHAAPDANHREAEHQQSPICTGSKQVLLPDATDTTRHSHPQPSQSCQYLQGKDTSNVLQMGCST